MVVQDWATIIDIGYKIVVARDLVATTSNSPSTQERTLQIVEKTYGVVVDSAEIMMTLRLNHDGVSTI